MTGKLARICAQRPLITIGVWLVLIVIALALIRALLPSATTTEFSLAGRYESERASSMLEDRLRGPKPLSELVIVQSPSLTVDDPEFRSKVESVHARIVALGPDFVLGGQHYYLDNDEIRVSQDRRTTLMNFVLAGDFKEATENVGEVIHAVEEADGSDDFRVLIGGDASVAYENNELSAEDLEKGERIGVPVALIILLALFGAVVATLLPLGLAIVAIVIALAAVGIIGQSFELIFFVNMMITMIGLAVGIDYSLLIVSRFREEMSRGLGKREAVERAGDTAGRTVLFSGTTVVLALIGMLIVPSVLFPVPRAGRHPGGCRRSGRHPHAFAGGALVARPQGGFPVHPFPWQVLPEKPRSLGARILGHYHQGRNPFPGCQHPHHRRSDDSSVGILLHHQNRAQRR